MDTYKSSSQLKAIAKEQCLGRYGTLIGANIILFAIEFILSGIVTYSGNGSILLIIINTLISLILNILLGILVSGKAYLYMNVLYSQTVSTTDLFFGFKQQPQKAVIIQSVLVIAQFIMELPAQIILILSQKSSFSSIIPVLLFVFALGLILNIYISLVYSQSFFILHDFPDRSAKEILQTSRRLMRGNKFRLFYLNVSFIPLYLLGCIALFVPLLWVSVYRYATNCAFYQDLISGASKTAE